jgi:hypothetical protein
VQEVFKAYLPFDFIITFYERNTGLLSENQQKILMLPVDYRPKKQFMFVVVCSDGSYTYPGSVVVSPDGTATILGVQHNGYLTLTGISFLT